MYIYNIIYNCKLIKIILCRNRLKYLFLYLVINFFKEREREREKCKFIYLYFFLHVNDGIKAISSKFRFLNTVNFHFTKIFLEIKEDKPKIISKGEGCKDFEFFSQIRKIGSNLFILVDFFGF